MYGNSFFPLFLFPSIIYKSNATLQQRHLWATLWSMLFDPVSRKPGWNPIPSQLNPTFSCLHQCSYWLFAVFIETLLCFFISHSLPPENVNKYNKSSCRSKQCQTQPVGQGLFSILHCLGESPMLCRLSDGYFIPMILAHYCHVWGKMLPRQKRSKLPHYYVVFVPY